MPIFEKEDKRLIKALLDDGVPFSEVANKWGINQPQLARYCWRNKISYKSKEIELSEAHEKIIRLHGSHAIDTIAQMTHRSERTVRRVIAEHCKDTFEKKHRQRVDAVSQLAQSQSLSLREACSQLGVTYGAYDYSRRFVNKLA